MTHPTWEGNSKDNSSTKRLSSTVVNDASIDRLACSLHVWQWCQCLMNQQDVHPAIQLQALDQQKIDMQQERVTE